MSTEPTTGQIEESLLPEAYNEDVEVSSTEEKPNRKEQDLFAMFLALSEQDFSNKPQLQQNGEEATNDEDRQETLEFPEEELADAEMVEVSTTSAHVQNLSPSPLANEVDAGSEPDFVIHPGPARAQHPELEQTARPYGPKPAGRSEKDNASALKDEVEGPLDALLRDREALLDVIMKGKGLVSVARVMLITVVVCGAALGASVGMYRGGIQILFAGIKLPLVLLMTTAVCAPVYTALKMAMRERASLLEDFALVLSSLALASVVAASLAPLLLLAIFNDYSYHTLTLLMVGICGLGGVCGFLFFTKGLRRQVVAAERMIYLVFLCVIGVVSMQVSWLMRPYLVRPQTEDVPFVRSLEGSFFEAVRVSADSARGVYAYDSFSAEDYQDYERTTRSIPKFRDVSAPEPTRALEGTRTRTSEPPVLTGRYREDAAPAESATEVVTEPSAKVANPTPEDAEILQEGDDARALLIEAGEDTTTEVEATP